MFSIRRKRDGGNGRGVDANFCNLAACCNLPESYLLIIANAGDLCAIRGKGHLFDARGVATQVPDASERVRLEKHQFAADAADNDLLTIRRPDRADR